MSDVNYLLGNKEIYNRPLPIFSNEASDFLDELSKEILALNDVRKFPDLVTFAFWIRKSNLKRVKGNYGKLSSRLGRGLCFHIAPSNIPINFAFSYVFSLLAGNANIVRLPSKSFFQVELFIRILKSIIAKHPAILKRTSFVQYPSDSSATAFFSGVADVRMIWGGDRTIDQIRQIRTKPRGVDITFADRYSICIIESDHVLNLTNEELRKMAERFYNDTYLMDQNACSSPQLICWLNSNEQAKNIFWENIYKVVIDKYKLEDSIAIEKYIKFCEDSISLKELKSIKYSKNLLYRVHLNKIDVDIDQYRGKAGYFYEYDCNSLEDLAPVISDKFQTVTYLGVDPQQIRDFVITQCIRGVDRVVPIGEAMSIDILWDGHDLITELSREIVVK